jgi:putative ABC transport system ATP-binding protein
MITVADLRVTFNAGTPIENPALRGIDLAISEGEFVSVIGSNGAGKSTLLNCIAGETLPDSGRIEIGETEVTRWDAASRSAMVARVFQDPMAGTCEDLTIEENLALASARGERRGLGMALTDKRQTLFRERLADLGLGLEDRLTDRMGLLSGGQRQAVSLIMATLQPTNILVLDEHTAALDPRMSAFVMELSQSIIERDKLTALMVTHSMRQALDFGSRTVMLHAGKVVFDVAGEERRGLTVEDLIEKFAKSQAGAIDSDKLLLG